MMHPITIVAGAQWGSEGKGMVAGALALRQQYSYAVRTGAINAGHTVYYRGSPFAMQQLPVAWVNPRTRLVIGPGAYVHMPTLLKEIAWVEGATGDKIFDRLFVDTRVGVHLDSYSEESKEAQRHQKIGATGKGCAEAVIHKLRDRGDRELLLIRTLSDPWNVPWQWADTAHLLTQAYHDGKRIMLEGTQGELLDFHLGPWPYVTSRQTTAAAWVAEAGLSPSLDYEVVLVARTYPIRVAGNSGPMVGEITWPILAREIRAKLEAHQIGSDHPLWVDEGALLEFERAVGEIGAAVGEQDALLHHHLQSPEWRVKYRTILSDYAGRAMSMMMPPDVDQIRKLFEITTVTRKLRRIARMDHGQLSDTIYRINPGRVVVSFVNYELPHLHRAESLLPSNRADIRALFPMADAVTTGPESEHLIWI